MKETDQEFAAQVLRLRVDIFSRSLSKLISSVSGKSIHETRVESRRMRAALKAFRPMFPLRPYRLAYKDIRQITGLLGKPRQTAVNLSLVKDLADDSTVERSCLKYLTSRLNSRLKRQVARMEVRIKRLDSPRIQSRLDSLLSVMESDQANSAEAAASPARRPSQPTLFPMRESAVSQAARTLKSVVATISEYRTERRFDTDADAEIHSLRIATKKVRYAMELYSPVWIGGLEAQIEKARKFQDAAGSYHDWSMLLCYLKKQIKRLNSPDSVRLAFEIGRLAEAAAQRKTTLKASMREALLALQESIASLHHIIDLLVENPDLNVMKGSLSVRPKPQVRNSKAAQRSATRRMSART